VAEDRSDSETRSAGPRIPPRRLSDDEYASAARRRLRVAGLALIAVGVAAMLILTIGRDSVIATWPATARVYAALGLVARPGAGLTISLSTARRGGSLVVTGDIANAAGEARSVPPLRVTLRDARPADLESTVIDPPVARLAPGATAHFETVFEHPGMTATGATATFAPDQQHR
jgi:hypothetical protein